MFAGSTGVTLHDIHKTEPVPSYSFILIRTLCFCSKERIRDQVRQAKVFVTFDIDVVDPAFAPGTSTPEVGVFTSGEAIDLIRGLTGLNFVGFDVVEILPDYNTADLTALLAANIIYEFLSLISLNKRNSKLKAISDLVE